MVQGEKYLQVMASKRRKKSNKEEANENVVFVGCCENTGLFHSQQDLKCILTCICFI